MSEEQSIDEVDAMVHIPNLNTRENIPRQSVGTYSSTYDMSHLNRGFAIIFNHMKFDNPSLQPRPGNMGDSLRLLNTLEKLHFKTFVFCDLDFDEIKGVIKNIHTNDHSDADCLVIAILTHGYNGFLHAKDRRYRLDGLWTFFTENNCPTLAGKPKWFLIHTSEAKPASQADELDIMFDEKPIHADFLVVYSMIADINSHLACDHTLEGSLFLNQLCLEIMRKGTTHDLLHVLTFVCRNVAEKLKMNIDDPRRKQIPSITTKLTKILRFETK